ncbi:MAG: hypothetical protein C5B52_14935 [Bacteroidetes bacterium]|nr:MAG: hypothetical protein C5B52_14935 [Bacteroidota bacterium]
MIPFHTTVEKARHQLESELQQKFTIMMKHGTMQVEFFAPENIDTQSPHKQDELYIIASGNAIFNRNQERIHCKTGDVLFVPAAMQHRFEHFSEDFATWVIFYGPQGGEIQ